MSTPMTIMGLPASPRWRLQYLRLIAVGIAMHMMTCIIVVNGFAPSSIVKRDHLLTMRTSNNVPTNKYNFCLGSAVEPNDVNTLSPAAAFGSPISEEVSAFNKKAITFVKNTLFDSIYNDGDDAGVDSARTYARFYALETIARMPYFAYLSVLHLYETLGMFRKANYMKLHFTESWNEMHHLLIMEELGGNQDWADRFLAQHTAFFYYWFVVVVYLVNPIMAYNLNEAVEDHAFHTYDTFIHENAQELQNIKAPKVAKDYYGSINEQQGMIMHTPNYSCDDRTGKIQVEHAVRDANAPIQMETLLDVFIAIRADEAEHANTMRFLQSQASDIDLKREEGEECLIN